MDAAGTVAEEDAEIVAEPGTQSASQEEDWEDLADTKVCTSLHICDSLQLLLSRIHSVVLSASKLVYNDAQMTPQSSIHILAKSSENIHPNAQAAGHDWIDLKEKPEEAAVKNVKEQPEGTAVKDVKEQLRAPDVDRAQHEVAALKMVQGLLKGAASTSQSTLTSSRVATAAQSAFHAPHFQAKWSQG